jgi:hypothetical protein
MADEDEPEAPKARPLRFAGREIPLPQSRGLRIGLGIALVLGGIVGFLPILGFWMVPLGLLVLSVDLPPVRRARRRLSVWWARRRAR